MANSILVTATQRGSGKSLVTLGLINHLESVLGRVGYFKPVAQRGLGGLDPDVALMKGALGLGSQPEVLVGVTLDQVSEALAKGTYDDLIGTIIERFERASEGYDFVVCEGTDYFGAMAAFEFNVNADLSKALGAPMLLVASAASRVPNGDGPTVENGPASETVASHLRLVRESCAERRCEMFGVVVNRAEPAQLAEMKHRIEAELSGLGVRLLGVIPKTDVLEKLRVEEVAAALGAEVVSGRDRLSNVVQETVVAAMTVENFLGRLPKGALVVAPGDREDLALALAAAYVSPAAPRPAGVVMTGGLQPGPNVRRLFLDVTGGQMPVLKVSSGTYETAVAIAELRPSLSAHQRMRVEVVKNLVERYVDVEPLLARAVVRPRTRKVTPKQFMHRFVQMARKDRRHVVLPEGTEPRIVRAAAVVAERGIADLTLLGAVDEVRFVAAHEGLRLPPEVRIVDPATSEHRELFARRYIELRSPKKTPTWELSYDLMRDPTYFGTMMVHEGQAHGMVSGAATTTAATLRPALEFVKTKPGYSIASSVFFMCLPDQVVLYGDCAVNPDPTAEELSDIALAAAETARAFDIEPFVAMLSYSTGASGRGTAVDKVRRATELVRERAPELPVEGPIQYDAAIDPDVARTKLPGSRVAGAATVFIFPDLDSGNNTYKAVQRSANAIAIGPVMQGLRKPVNDLSRGCTVADIINTVAITAVQAQRT